MKIFNISITKLHSLVAALVIASAIFVGSGEPASANGGISCHVYTGGQFLYVFDGSPEMCARTIRASAYSAQYGIGYWSNTLLAVDSTGNVFFQDNVGQWRYAGVVTNPDGTVGSLWDRCMAGDVNACQTYSNNANNFIQLWDYLYP